tara:strand:+ start:19 stop:984 length:966 start_codon:yes stop_codon:yes gene_type:complete
MDGSKSIYDWKEKLPIAHQPHSLNPERGYLSSANQNPVDQKYPYFIPGNYAPLFRGARIDEILKKTDKATYKDLQEIQNDNKSLLAERVVIRLLETINQNLLSDDQKFIYNSLMNWDYFYNPNSKMPGLFDSWMKSIAKNTWEDDLGIADDDVEWPNFRILSDLIIHDPNSKWFDNKNTSEIENLDIIANKTFIIQTNDILSKIGPVSEKWEWQNYRGTDIHHLAKIPGFGNLNLPTGGDWNIPNATAKTHGPSWRYVVELGDRPKGYGIYPGGQSGYPGSIYYDQFIESWVKGELYELNFPFSIDEINGPSVLFIPKEKS